MNIPLAVLVFLLFYLCHTIDIGVPRPLKRTVLILLCVIFAMVAGFRDIDRWPDTFGYVGAFNHTPSLFNYSEKNDDVLDIYRENGFYYLSVFFKTFFSSGVFYLVCISILTFLLLFKVLRKYSVYPLMGFCVYLSRFFLMRNMMQIRAAISILLVVLFTSLIKERKTKAFFLIVLLATTIHYSAIIFIPVFYFCRINFSKKQISLLLILFFISSYVFIDNVVLYIVNTPALYPILSPYLDENTYGYSAGLTNPMIYYHLFLLYLYVHFEDKISIEDRNYYIIRNAYLFGTIILISFNSLAVIAGRLTTIFDTYEILMIPSILHVLQIKKRLFASFISAFLLSAIFYINYITKL